MYRGPYTFAPTCIGSPRVKECIGELFRDWIAACPHAASPTADWLYNGLACDLRHSQGNAAFGTVFAFGNGRTFSAANALDPSSRKGFEMRAGVRKNWSSFFGLVVFGVFCSAFVGQAAADIVIDDFSSTTLLGPSPVFGMFVNPGSLGPTTVNDTGASVFGGGRNVTLGAFGGSAGEYVTATVAAGMMKYASTNGGNSSLTLAYGGPAINLTGHGGIELQLMSFDFAYSTPMSIQVALFDGANAAVGTSTVSTAGSFPVDFPFATFSGIGALSLATVQSITVFFDAQVAHDFNVGPIVAYQQVIPEPASVAVWTLVGMVGLVVARRWLR